MSAFEELQSKLREIFQLDRSDLDFGLYRIMNLKSAEISDFIDNELLSQVKDGLKSYSLSDNQSITEELKKAEEQAKELGMNPEDAPKVKELKEKLENSFDALKIENEIYSDLYNFFKRYYLEGDFLSLRRYKEGVYALPYEGEEVKLHWANADQYYIKSGETLTNYTFKVGKYNIRFEVVAASTEQNNNKDDKNRRFKLLTDKPIYCQNNEFIISFSYLPDNQAEKQEELNKEACEILLANDILMPVLYKLKALTGPEKNKIPVLLKHLNNFTAKNTFDYFIHKDLGKFLNRELDFYIKNEIMHLDDIEEENAPKVEQYLGKVKVLRKVARKIITFLASLEDFQKKIWLKKKFVLETNYCITLDRVPEALYPIIIANEAQIEEWIKLFSIDEIKADGKTLLDHNKVAFTKPLTIEFLKANPYLVLDTAFFDTDFKYKLLASIDDFDEQCDGLLIHSENFQALNLLQEKYRESIKCIYIDPPYNTNATEIVYKNGYRQSSWLSLCCSRLQLSKCLQTEDGIITVTIDDFEQSKLTELLNSIYGQENQLGIIAIRINPKGRMTERKASLIHEYALFYGVSDLATIKKLPVSPEEKTHNYQQDDDGKWYLPVNLRKQGVDSEAQRADGTFFDRYYPIYYDPETKRLSTHEKLKIEIWPIDLSGQKRIWRKAKEDIDSAYLNGEIWAKENANGIQLYYKFRGGLDGKMVQSLWIDAKYSASDHGTRILDNQIGKREQFSYPKSPYAVEDCIRAMNHLNDGYVLDYFAGSGTTGNAVINLNREDGGKRKYILVEMGNYFDLVTKPRIEKVIYSKDWKDGKPVSREGSSHCFKYIRLESYEDALDNLQFERTPDQGNLLNKLHNKAVKEEYMLNYMMDLETKDSLLNIQKFAHPFDYELKITRDGETKTVKVDLPETFNYLIGLKVSSVRISQGILVIDGKTRDGENTLVLWRDASKTSSAELDKWFEKQHYSTLDMEFDTIYVNGDNNLENLRKPDETWKVRLIEAEFQKRMFDVKDV